MQHLHISAVSLACVLLVCHQTQLVYASEQNFPQSNNYAVVIGISQYREEVIPKVAYAVKDAEAIAQLLESQGGIPKVNIKLLTGAKATIGDLRSHFGDWLQMRIKPDSTVYVYFAGHGTPNPQTGEAYLVPWDGHPDFLSGLFPLKELYETLSKLPAKDIIVFLDSCFSGAPGRSVLQKGARPMVISVENPLLASGNVIVLAASTGNQISSDYDRSEHGLFTYYLLKGLRGAADQDQDQRVTLKELAPYVRQQVAKTSVDELNREQTPVLLPGENLISPRIAKPLVRKRADRERFNLRGAVKTVVEEYAVYFWIGKEMVEQNKRLGTSTTFDSYGNIAKFMDGDRAVSIDDTSYLPKDDYEDVPRSTKREHEDGFFVYYDDKGNIIEEGKYSSDGKLADTGHLTYTFDQFDSHGNWTKKTAWGDEPKGRSPDRYKASSVYRTITYYPETAGQ